MSHEETRRLVALAVNLEDAASKIVFALVQSESKPEVAGEVSAAWGTVRELRTGLPAEPPFATIGAALDEALAMADDDPWKASEDIRLLGFDAGVAATKSEYRSETLWSAADTIAQASNEVRFYGHPNYGAVVARVLETLWSAGYVLDHDSIEATCLTRARGFLDGLVGLEPDALRDRVHRRDFLKEVAVSVRLLRRAAVAGGPEVDAGITAAKALRAQQRRERQEREAADET